jgi:hypothetical protein
MGKFILHTQKKCTLPGGLEPPTSWLTAKRANRLRHGSYYFMFSLFLLLVDITESKLRRMTTHVS